MSKKWTMKMDVVENGLDLMKWKDLPEKFKLETLIDNRSWLEYFIHDDTVYCLNDFHCIVKDSDSESNSYLYKNWTAIKCSDYYTGVVIRFWKNEDKTVDYDKIQLGFYRETYG